MPSLKAFSSGLAFMAISVSQLCSEHTPGCQRVTAETTAPTETNRSASLFSCRKQSEIVFSSHIHTNADGKLVACYQGEHLLKIPFLFNESYETLSVLSHCLFRPQNERWLEPFCAHCNHDNNIAIQLAYNSIASIG